MGKRVVLGLFVFVSAMAVWWTTAEAQSCLAWTYVGSGRYVCAVWSPKGLDLNLTFKEPCVFVDEGGTETATCEGTAQVVSSDNVAFCADPTAPQGVRRVDCPGARRFQQVFTTDCEPKGDNESATGAAHENNQNAPTHGCTQRIIFMAACGTCCAGIGTGVCLDVTPVEFEAQVTAGIVGLDFEAPVAGGALAASPTGQACDPDSPVCTFNQHCSINPKKIPFIPLTEVPPPTVGQKYQCDVTCVGSECPPPVIPD